MSKEFVSQEYEVAQAGADVREGTRRSRILKFLSTISLFTMIIISIAAVSFSLIFFLSEVNGSSMMQTLNKDFIKVENEVSDNVLVNRFASAKRGDIIVVKNYSDGNLSHYIKRLICIEDDKIRLEKKPDNTYQTIICYAGTDQWIVLDEWYLDLDRWGIMTYYGRNFYNLLENPDSIRESNPFYPSKQHIVTPQDEKPYLLVPKNHVFYMGDNRGGVDESYSNYSSYDCTSFGPQPAEYIEGVVVSIIKQEESIPSFVLRKIGEFFSFKWLFG